MRPISWIGKNEGIKIAIKSFYFDKSILPTSPYQIQRIVELS